MTDLAFGVRTGLPLGIPFARATPSRCSMAQRASPVKPMPRSARKARREARRRIGTSTGCGSSGVIAVFLALCQFALQVFLVQLRKDFIGWLADCGAAVDVLSAHGQFIVPS